MAKKRRNKCAAQPTEVLLDHMRRIDAATVEEYLAWCGEHGFSRRLDKGWGALKKEREEVAARRVRASFAQARKFSKPIDALTSALAGELEPGELRAGDLRTACELLCKLRDGGRPHVEELSEMLRAVAARARFLMDDEVVGDRRVPYLRGLVTLNERRGQWLRPLDEWRPRSHNRRKQFASLARHLVADYPVPGFLDAAWLRRDKGSHAHRDLFVHIGRGNNPRTGRTPVPLSKKEAHFFLTAPDHYSIEGAVRWGQVLALGGSPRLVDALVATPLGATFAHEEFWSSVLRFFVDNPMLDPASVGPLIDYIDHQKFRSTDVVQADGRVRTEPPPQPGFSMARRTPAALLAQMERWHARLGRAHAAGAVSWAPAGPAEFTWETGRTNAKVWTIRELRSSQALLLEGRAMKHCVSSYARSCAAGRCSIWSLEVRSRDGLEKRQTVEVSRQGVIVQSRGKLNALPKQQDLDVLRRWAEREGLALATYL